jgi:hypothetical protein
MRTERSSRLHVTLPEGCHRFGVAPEQATLSLSCNPVAQAIGRATVARRLSSAPHHEVSCARVTAVHRTPS